MLDRQWREEWRYDGGYGQVKQHYRGPAELGGIIGGSLHGGGYWQYRTWDRYYDGVGDNRLQVIGGSLYGAAARWPASAVP